MQEPQSIQVNRTASLRKDLTSVLKRNHFDMGSLQMGLADQVQTCSAFIKDLVTYEVRTNTNLDSATSGDSSACYSETEQQKRTPKPTLREAARVLIEENSMVLDPNYENIITSKVNKARLLITDISPTVTKRDFTEQLDRIKLLGKDAKVYWVKEYKSYSDSWFTVIFRNIPYFVMKEHIEDLCRKENEKVLFVGPKTTIKGSDCCLVRFSSVEEAESACKRLNNFLFRYEGEKYYLKAHLHPYATLRHKEDSRSIFWGLLKKDFVVDDMIKAHGEGALRDMRNPSTPLMKGEAKSSLGTAQGKSEAAKDTIPNLDLGKGAMDVEQPVPEKKSKTNRPSKSGAKKHAHAANGAHAKKQEVKDELFSELLISKEPSVMSNKTEGLPALQSGLSLLIKKESSQVNPPTQLEAPDKMKKEESKVDVSETVATNAQVNPSNELKKPSPPKTSASKDVASETKREEPNAAVGQGKTYEAPSREENKNYAGPAPESSTTHYTKKTYNKSVQSFYVRKNERTYNYPRNSNNSPYYKKSRSRERSKERHYSKERNYSKDRGRSNDRNYSKDDKYTKRRDYSRDRSHSRNHHRSKERSRSRDRSSPRRHGHYSRDRSRSNRRDRSHSHRRDRSHSNRRDRSKPLINSKESDQDHKYKTSRFSDYPDERSRKEHESKDRKYDVDSHSSHHRSGYHDSKSKYNSHRSDRHHYRDDRGSSSPRDRHSKNNYSKRSDDYHKYDSKKDDRDRDRDRDRGSYRDKARGQRSPRRNSSERRRDRESEGNDRRTNTSRETDRDAFVKSPQPRKIVKESKH